MSHLGIIAMGITCVTDHPQTIEVCTALATVLKYQLLLKPLRCCILCHPSHKVTDSGDVLLVNQSLTQSVIRSVIDKSQ